MISKAFLSMISNIIHFFIKQMFCRQFLWSWNQQIEKSKKLTIQTFICYLIYSGARKASRKTMQHKGIWFAL